MKACASTFAQEPTDQSSKRRGAAEAPPRHCRSAAIERNLLVEKAAVSQLRHLPAQRGDEAAAPARAHDQLEIPDA
jgi:hypothetical protein